MGIVFIRGLQIETVIGVYDWERQIKQTVSLDLEMAHDNHGAARTDSVEDALDYSAVAGRLMNFIGDSDFQLLETMAEQCAAVIMEEFSVPWLRLRLSKPGAVRAAQEVGVIIERGAMSDAKR